MRVKYGNSIDLGIFYYMLFSVGGYERVGNWYCYFGYFGECIVYFCIMLWFWKIYLRGLSYCC